MKKRTTSRTLDAFLRDLADQNKSISAWAQEHGFSLNAVYAVTMRRNSGVRGQSREIVRAMGLPLPPPFKPRREAA